MSEARAVIDGQLDAYNRQDVDAFAQTYARDAVITMPDGSVAAEGRDAIRAMYQQMFTDSPSMHASIASRIEIGDFVIDEELVEGVAAPGLPESLRAVVAYRVADGLISSARMYY